VIERGDPDYKPCRRTPGPLSSGEGIVYAIRDRDQNDPGVKDKRLLIVDGEFGSAFMMMQREGNILSTTIRSAWDGEQIEPLTKHNRICASSPHLCIVGHITQDELLKLLSLTNLQNGFANRFLWCCVRRAKRVPFPAELDTTRVQALAQGIATTIDAACRREQIRLAPDAQALWEQEYEALTEDRTGNYGAATSRAEAQVYRLALIFALLDESQSISAAHFEAALALWRYCDASALYLFGNPETEPRAQKILEALTEGPKTQTELNRLFSGKLRSEDLADVLKRLQAVGKITQSNLKTGGRNRTTWRLRT
jgi:hypothetical protein